MSISGKLKTESETVLDPSSLDCTLATSFGLMVCFFFSGDNHLFVLRRLSGVSASLTF